MRTKIPLFAFCLPLTVWHQANAAQHTVPLPILSEEFAFKPTYLSNEDNRLAALVEPLIAEMRQKFATNPMVRLLASPEGKAGLTFLPFMTFFVNSFSDVNRMVLPYHDNVANDPLKTAINKHCEEDSTHLHLLWEDLLQHQREMQEAGVATFIDAVHFLWSDKLYKVRELGYQVSKLAGMASKPIHRYCMIRVMEEVGNVFFTTGVGYALKNGTPSQYLGHDHLALEDGHLQNQEIGEVEEDGNSHDLDALAQLFVFSSFESAADRELAEEIMVATYQLFYDMLECVHENMWQMNKAVRSM